MKLYEFSERLYEIAWKTVAEVLGNEEEYAIQVDVTNKGTEDTEIDVVLFLDDERSLTLEPLRLSFCNVNLSADLSFKVTRYSVFPKMETELTGDMTLEEYVDFFKKELTGTRAQIILENLIVNA